MWASGGRAGTAFATVALWIAVLLVEGDQNDAEIIIHSWTIFQLCDCVFWSQSPTRFGDVDTVADFEQPRFRTHREPRPFPPLFGIGQSRNASLGAGETTVELLRPEVACRRPAPRREFSTAGNGNPSRAKRARKRCESRQHWKNLK